MSSPYQAERIIFVVVSESARQAYWFVRGYAVTLTATSFLQPANQFAELFRGQSFAHLSRGSWNMCTPMVTIKVIAAYTAGTIMKLSNLQRIFKNLFHHRILAP